MFHRKMMVEQIQSAGVRIGDSCSIHPLGGRRKAFTLNRFCIDLISKRYRPDGLSLAYVELPHPLNEPFHYRLELDQKKEQEGRFVLKTLTGRPFWLNGHAAKEAYVERSDRLYIEDHKIHFNSEGLEALVDGYFDHPVLKMSHLIHSDLKILISGETGTGKTHLAQAIHEKSGRSGPFVAMNLASYNPQLIESELFGHKRGAFTGALSDKIGAVEVSHGGTLFLDEIDSLSWDLQTKLLTFIDNMKFRSVGDAREKEVKTRLIFAANRPLKSMVDSGLYRKDFFYRLTSGHELHLPSLRNETNKIKQACLYFSLKNQMSLTERLLDFYVSLAWPGNLRQLFGHLDKKKILSKGTKLDFDACDEELMLQSSDLMSLPLVEELVPMKQAKAEFVKRAVGLCDGNVAMASKKLGMNERTVRSILSEP